MRPMQLAGQGDPPRFDLREAPDFEIVPCPTLSTARHCRPPDIVDCPTPGALAKRLLVPATGVVSRPGSYMVGSLRAAEG